MQTISSKVSRAVSEQTDSSVYSIKANVNFSNSVIDNNDQFLSASTQSTVGVSNCNISNINATGSMIQLVSSTIYLDTVSITNITYVTQTTSFYKISIVNKSKFYGSNLLLQLFVGPMIYVSGSTFVLSKGSSIKQCRNDDKSNPHLSFDTSVITFLDSNFSQLYSNLYSPIIYLESNTFSSSNLSVSQFDKALFYISSGTYSFDYLNVSQSQMIWQVGVQIFQPNSVILEVISANLTLTNSQISGITSLYTSPAIYIYNDPSATSSLLLSLTNSTFLNNQALQNGGVIESVNTNVTVNNCTFNNNSAGQEGGVLYLSCSQSARFPCNYQVNSSRFTNNNAGLNGGAIKYDFYGPTFSSNNVFVNNNAQYGPDIASYPAQLVIIQNSITTVDTSTLKSLGLTNAVGYQLTQDLVSGSVMSQNISFQLLDEKGNLINTDSTSQITLSAVSTNVSVMQTKTVTAVNGQLEFNNAIVIGPPGTNVILQVTSNSIDSSQIEKAFPSLGQVPNMYISAYLRLCIRGEYQSSDNKCLVCQDGFYTLEANMTSCTECPEHAICTNGDYITVDEGYWRQSINSTNISACYNTDACPSNDNITCAVGYGGNLCQSCKKVNDTWYFAEGQSACSQCLSHSTATWRLLGVTILLVAYIILLILLTIKSAGQQTQTTVCMRILTNYFQILTLTSSFNLSWGTQITKFLKASSIIAQGSTILLSVDCLLRDSNVSIEPIFVKMILACIFLVVAIVLAILVWLFIGLCRKGTQVKRNIITSVIVLIFLFLPTISNITLAIYNCLDIFGDGTTYLAIDMSIQCWAGDQNKYAFSYGLPIVIVWIIGFPTLAFFILFRRRKDLHDPDFRATYGFIYGGLADHAFYWEILLHFRKILIISINVFFTTFVSLYRALIGFMLMIVYIEILQKIQPYRTKDMNDLELKANVAAFATFYGGLFLISDGIPFSVSIIIFLVIFFINLTFWVYWVKLIFSHTYARVKVFLQRKICPGRYQAQLKIQFEKDQQCQILDESGLNSPNKTDKAMEESQREIAPEQDSERIPFNEPPEINRKEKKSKKEKKLKKKRREKPQERFKYATNDEESQDEEAQKSSRAHNKKSMLDQQTPSKPSSDPEPSNLKFKPKIKRDASTKSNQNSKMKKDEKNSDLEVGSGGVSSQMKVIEYSDFNSSVNFPDEVIAQTVSYRKRQAQQQKLIEKQKAESPKGKLKQKYQPTNLGPASDRKKDEKNDTSRKKKKKKKNLNSNQQLMEANEASNTQDQQQQKIKQTTKSQKVDDILPIEEVISLE